MNDFIKNIQRKYNIPIKVIFLIRFIFMVCMMILVIASVLNCATALEELTGKWYAFTLSIVAYVAMVTKIHIYDEDKSLLRGKWHPRIVYPMTTLIVLTNLFLL